MCKTNLNIISTLEFIRKKTASLFHIDKISPWFTLNDKGFNGELKEFWSEIEPLLFERFPLNS